MHHPLDLTAPPSPARRAGWLALAGRLLTAQTTPWLPAAVYAPLAAGLIVAAAWAGAPSWQLAVLPAAGLALWTLLEYVIHSLAFHHTLRFLRLRSVQAAHALHHDHPSRPEHMVSQLSFTVPVAAALFGILYLATGNLPAAGLLLAGAVLGYLAYEFVHYFVHQRRKPNWLPRGLVKHHLYHHYKDQTRCYGVTSPLWDIVFRTGPKRNPPR